MISLQSANKWLALFTEALIEQKTYLSQLDTAIGDGDHGNNLARGAGALKEKLTAADHETLSALFKDAGMTFISKVGGASGPLYGSAFVAMAKASETEENLISVLEAGLTGIQKRGKAKTGEKTMVDVWAPVIEALKEQRPLEAAIEESVARTEGLKAAKGRASYLGGRSIGHLDPGAVSSGIFFQTMLKAGVYDG